MNAKGLLQNKYVRMLKDALTAWWNDQAPSKGAALAYYSMFSIAPLLYLIISIAGLFFGPDAVRGMVFEQIGALMGQNGAEAIREMLAHVSEPKTGRMTAAVSIAVLLFSASSVFGQLQTALDTIWRVPEAEKRKQQANGVWSFVRSRLLTFGMVLGLAFLVTVSLLLSTALSALGKWWGPFFGQWETLAHVLDIVVNFGVLTVVFGAIYKLMPGAHIQWRDVWVGGAALRRRQVPDRPLPRQGRRRLELRRIRLDRDRDGVDLLFGADLPPRRGVHLGVRARARIAPWRASAEGESRRSDGARAGLATRSRACARRPARRATAGMGFAKRFGSRPSAQGTLRRDDRGGVSRRSHLAADRGAALKLSQFRYCDVETLRRAFHRASGCRALCR
jgi:YihY family inner membrane protein